VGRWDGLLPGLPETTRNKYGKIGANVNRTTTTHSSAASANPCQQRLGVCKVKNSTASAAVEFWKPCLSVCLWRNCWTRMRDRALVHCQHYWACLSTLTACYCGNTLPYADEFGYSSRTKLHTPTRQAGGHCNKLGTGAAPTIPTTRVVGIFALSEELAWRGVAHFGLLLSMPCSSLS
jgi:hypothetical protein